MVENQHSINTILSFGAKSVNPEILEKLLIGREKTADYLFNAVKSIAEDGNNNQQLIIGQRGMGKTHLFRILFHRIQKYITNKKLVVAYFSEEEYGVANYFDFLTRIINALVKWNDADKEELLLKIEELQETQAKAQVNVAEKIIEDYIGKRPLLILAENFSDILDSIKPAEQSKLRAWLYKVNRISIIASSQSISKDFDKEDRPFYGFFNLYYLKNLDFEGSLEFLISLAKLDKRDDVVKHLENKGRGQVKAIHQLVKGNHRLLVTFYEFLKTDTLAKLSSHFIKTINDLKPYYETYIRYLPAQQQKILRYVALARKPQQGTDISKNCFIDQKSLSKQMSELSRKSLIEIIVDTDDKRNKLYDILEPLLRISIEVGEHREGITSLFIDFLAIYYNENELSDRKNKFHNLLSNCESHNERMDFNYEIQAIDRALELKKTIYKDLDVDKSELINIVYNLIDIKDWTNAEEKIKKIRSLINKNEYYILLAELSFAQEDFLGAIEIYNKSEKENVADSNIYNNWGSVLTTLGKLNLDNKKFIEGFSKYKKASILNPNDYTIYFNWGKSLNDYSEFRNDKNTINEVIDKYETASIINPYSIQVFNNLGVALYNVAKINSDVKLYKKSLENLKKARDLNTNDYIPHNNLGNVLTDFAILNSDEKIFEQSFKEYTRAIKINKKYYTAYVNFAISISDYNLTFFKENSVVKTLLSYININFNINDKHIFYNELTLAYLNNYYLLQNLYQNIKKDIEFLINVKSNLIVNWITNILKEKRNNLSSEKIAFLISVTENHKKDFPELLILEKYLIVFEEYVINGNKKSLYSLPKEQRTFFKENILGI
ncbi:hypothetical protein [Flavobacterium sp.]|uniref:hypothetical protein n=1 Tax=Flavobacterium sp. TaxID=239 RepID=UPI0037515BE8